jgi:multidrug efflux pump subunit AcrB
VGIVIITPPRQTNSSITALFVERPSLVFVLLALIFIAGGFAFNTLIRQEFPNFDLPVVSVSVSYPGASPTELRDSVVRPIEDAIAGTPGLQHLTSSIQLNQASITAQFSLDTDKTTDLTEVQNRMQNVRSVLPQDLPAPNVRSFDPSQATVVTLAAHSTQLSFTDLSSLVNNSVVPALEQVPGVSNVNASGSVTPALEVYLDPTKLNADQLASTDIVASIQANNARRAGGILTLGNHETNLDVRADVQNIQSLLSTPLSVNTSTLQGTTSSSGTSTVRYSRTSGSTLQALNRRYQCILNRTPPFTN